MNSLETEELRRFLRASPKNLAVLAEHTAAEIMKQELDQLALSCRILAQFPRQVLMLKGNSQVANVSPFVGAISNRFIDREATKSFPRFCEAVDLALLGHRSYREQLSLRRRWARDRVESIALAFGDQAEALQQLRSQIRAADLRKIKLNEVGLSPDFKTFLLAATTELAANLTSSRSTIRALKPGPHLVYDFTWRYALCHLLQLISLIANGATRRAVSKTANDHFDCVYATFGTYFNGLMSNDRLALRTQVTARAVLRSLGARVAPDYIESGYDLELLKSLA